MALGKSPNEQAAPKRSTRLIVALIGGATALRAD